MDFNRETVLDELNDFEKRSNEISPVLEDYLLRIAKSGDTVFPWNKLKPLFKRKLELVLTDFYESCPTDNLPPLPNVENFKYEVLRAKILEAVDSFESAPFTIQRLCELVTDPRRHYKRTDKFMRGVEKNVLVVSTIEPRSPFRNEVYNNSNASLIVNGLISTTTTNSLQGTLASDDNGNMSPSSVTTTTKSSVNGSIPLDNFANVFSSAPCMTTSTDIHSSTTSSHDSSFQNTSSVENFNANENNNNEVMKVDRLNDSGDGQLADSAMDTSPDPSEHSHVLNLYHSEQNVDSPSETSQSSMPESTDDHSLSEAPCTQISQEEPSSSGTVEMFQHKTSTKASDVEESSEDDDSAAVPTGSGDKAVSSKPDVQESDTEDDDKSESDQPNYVVSSSQGEENSVSVSESHPDDSSVSQSHIRLPDSVESTKSTEGVDGLSSPHSPSKEDAMNMVPPSSSEQSEVSDSVQGCKDVSNSCEAEAMEQD